MKFQSFLILLLLIPFSNLKGQIDKGNISLRGSSNDGKIFLRWVPKDFDTWITGVNKGYRIYRFNKSFVNGEGNEEMFPEDAYFESKKIFDVQSKTEDELLSLGGDQRIMAAVAMFRPDSFDIYGFSTDQEIENRGIEERKNLRLFFGILAANESLEIARDLGLGFIDDQVQIGIEYEYFIVLNDDENNYIRFNNEISLSRNDGERILEIKETINGIKGDSLITLQWNVDSLESFVSYDIYRSYSEFDGFEKQNSIPFYPNGGAKTLEYPNFIPNNDDYFYYYLKGKDIFGFTSNNSAVLKIRGKPKPIQFSPSIDSISEMIIGEKIKISWSFPIEQEHLISSFQLWSSIERNGTFSPIDSNINPAKREFEISNPSQKGEFYYVIAKDINENYIESVPSFYKITDNNPPSPPTGVAGIIDKNGLATIKWNPNTESDLKGYLVYRADHSNGEFIQITGHPIYQNMYEDYFDLSMIRESSYFKIMAIDVNENRSDYSPEFQLQLPDIVPPSNPVIVKYDLTLKGVDLYFRPSYSKDLKSISIERKSELEPNWITIKSYQKQNFRFGLDTIENYLFTDTLVSTFLDYEYRVKASDKSDNFSYSTKIYARPIGNGFRPMVQNYLAFQEPLSNQTPSSNLIASTLKSNKGIINIYWEYPDFENIYDFEVFRKIPSIADFVRLKTVSPSEALFTGFYSIPPSKLNPNSINIGIPPRGFQNPSPSSLGNTNANLKPSTNYAFKVVDDDVFIIRNQKSIRDLEYKILARFRDGSSSVLTQAFHP
jgi:uncharacterized protein